MRGKMLKGKVCIGPSLLEEVARLPQHLLYSALTVAWWLNWPAVHLACFSLFLAIPLYCDSQPPLQLVRYSHVTEFQPMSLYLQLPLKVILHMILHSLLYSGPTSTLSYQSVEDDKKLRMTKLLWAWAWIWPNWNFLFLIILTCKGNKTFLYQVSEASGFI